MIGQKKGQAAMEYLMTYGWALLVIIIVLALLLIILGGYLRGTPSCMFEEAGFVCNEPAVPILSAAGALYGGFMQAKDEAINISRVACIEGQSSKAQVPSGAWKTVPAANQLLRPREFKTFSNLTGTAGLACYSLSGAGITATGGSQFRGQLWVEYAYLSDPAIGYTAKRSAVATVIANVE